MAPLEQERTMAGAPNPNAHLVGLPGGRARLATPALVLDLDVFERNLARMADLARAAGVGLRPHAKTHKSATIARRQIEAGALGVCCAKLGEAEALAAADPGLHGILLTSPVVAAGAVERLVDLNARVAGLKAVVDHPSAVEALGAAAARAGAPLELVVDLDIGLHRTGVADRQGALALARRIAEHPGLVLGGVQAYAGHLQHVADYADRRAMSLAALEDLAGTVAALRDAGLPPAIVTGSGTGTFAIDVDAGVFTELQCGSYLFMDVEYDAVGQKDGGAQSFEAALFVQMTVVSANAPAFVTVDGGLKAFATEGPKPRIVAGAPADAPYFFFGDEHGAVVAAADDPARPPLGGVVVAQVPHCDPTVNLYDSYAVVRGDTLVDIWPIEGRGRAQ
jgi:D-serine deaminase-like pyridoxal phosphate-dependent protein